MVGPGVVDVGSDLGYFEVGEGGNSGHWFIEAFTVYDQFALFSVSHKAEYFVYVITHII